MTETVVTDKTFGVRVAYPKGDHARAVRAWDLALRQMGRQTRVWGYLWIPARITSSTIDVDPPEARDDEAWEETTYAFTPRLADKVAAPVVRFARWYISLAHARVLYSPALIRTAQDGNRAANRILDVAYGVRENPNLHTTREITKRLGAHPYDWTRGNR